MAQNDLIRVVFPPLVLIVAVLGSILGGITNPTPGGGTGGRGRADAGGLPQAA